MKRIAVSFRNDVATLEKFIIVSIEGFDFEKAAELLKKATNVEEVGALRIYPNTYAVTLTRDHAVYLRDQLSERIKDYDSVACEEDGS